MLTLKTKLFSDCTEYWDGDQLVAGFDCGPGSLFMKDGDDVGLRFYTGGFYEDELRESGVGPIFPTGTAYVGILLDFHYEEIPIEPDFEGDMSDVGADLCISTDKGRRDFKAGEPELVAHYETQYENKSETIIVVNERTYHVIRSGRRILGAKTITTENGVTVGQVKERFSSVRVDFNIDLSLREKIFIALMQGDWDSYSDAPTPEEGQRSVIRQALHQATIGKWLEEKEGFEVERFERMRMLGDSFEKGEISEEDFRQQMAQFLTK